MSKDTVAILGCGPAGLLAAHAATMMGHPVVIFSKPQQSKLGGAQFLHQAIPNLTTTVPETVITYVCRGDADTYQRKVYGESANVPFVSFPVNGAQQAAWSLRAAYDTLWDFYGKHVNQYDCNANTIEHLLNEYPLMFNTVPLPLLCRARAGLIPEVHHFTVQEIAVCTDDYVADVEPDTIVYDGTPDRSWYRSSRILGTPGTEWSLLATQPPVMTIRDRKPIATTCACWPTIHRIGRRGMWKKGVLTHDAFNDVIRELSAL